MNDRIQYLKQNRHKEPEQLWRGFADKFHLSVSSKWFDSIIKNLDDLESDSECTTWAGEMKEMLRSERCDNWRGQYLLPKRSSLLGTLQRSTSQESAATIKDAQSMIRHARQVLSGSIRAEFDGLAAATLTPTTTSQPLSMVTTSKARDISAQGAEVPRITRLANFEPLGPLPP
ncbi:hypothetical protein BGZ76_007267, partial [Entomortierella beljakovae]